MPLTCSKLRRSYTGDRPKRSSERAVVVKTTFQCDFRHLAVGFSQQPGGGGDSGFCN